MLLYVYVTKKKVKNMYIALNVGQYGREEGLPLVSVAVYFIVWLTPEGKNRL